MSDINLLVQYYKVKFSKDIEYKQNEIDYVLKTNCNCKYINKIYLLLEEDYDLNFLTDTEKSKIIKEFFQYDSGSNCNFLSIKDLQHLIKNFE